MTPLVSTNFSIVEMKVDLGNRGDDVLLPLESIGSWLGTKYLTLCSGNNETTFIPDLQKMLYILIVQGT